MANYNHIVENNCYLPSLIIFNKNIFQRLNEPANGMKDKLRDKVKQQLFPCECRSLIWYILPIPNIIIRQRSNCCLNLCSQHVTFIVTLVNVRYIAFKPSVFL